MSLPSGSSLICDKLVKVELEIGNILLPATHLLVLDIEPSIILGNEFLIARYCTIYFAERQLDFKYKKKSY